MVYNSTLITLKPCACVYVITQVTCNDSSQHAVESGVKSESISQVTRVKSSHLGKISSQVKSSQKLRLESTRVRVSDLTCYDTA